MGSIYEYNHYKSEIVVSDNSIALERIEAGVRGNDLGTVTADNIDSFMSNHGICTGTFKDIYLGDYFTITYNGQDKTMLVADLDPYWGVADSGISDTHHVLIVPETYFQTSVMFDGSNSNIYLYLESNVHRYATPTIDKYLSNTFSDYLLYYYESAAGSVSNNDKTSLGNGRYLTKVRSITMNGREIGMKAISPNYDEWLGETILPRTISLFNADNSYLEIGTGWWLREITTPYTSDKYTYYLNSTYLIPPSRSFTNSLALRSRFIIGGSSTTGSSKNKISKPNPLIS